MSVGGSDVVTDYAHAEAAYKAFCRELRNGSRSLTSEARQIQAPCAWEWLTTIEKSAWLSAVTAARETP